MKKIITRTFYGWIIPKLDIYPNYNTNTIHVAASFSALTDKYKPCRITVEYPVRNPRVK